MMAGGPFDLSGRRALVTGGGGAIGGAIAEALAAAGARVAVLGRSETAEQTAAWIDGIATRADLSERADLERGFSDAVAALGGIDILVASHGTIASMLSFQGGLLAAAYATSRGVAQLTKALANEWAPLGVNVNAIASSTLPAARGSQSNPEVQCPTSFLSRAPRMPTEARSVLPDETPRRRRASTPVCGALPPTISRRASTDLSPSRCSRFRPRRMTRCA